DLVIKFKLDKVKWIVPGGETGQLSIYNALEAAYHSEEVDEEAVVLVHDGVRPVIDEELIVKNIQTTQEKGNAITVCKAIETVFSSHDKVNIDNVLDRETIYYAKAPQTFMLKELYNLHRKEIGRGNINNIDSCSMMYKEGIKLNFVVGKSSNIKITTYEDYCMYKALYELEKSVKTGEFIYE
ncbi:MAG: 2-C-methyl-D-erythritol 4-phosphate cytidylyltransferase, partial [Zhenhengia sp.]